MIGPSSPPHGQMRLVGITLIVGAAACFASLDTSAKLLNQSMAPLQTVASRYIGGFLLVGLYINPWVRPDLLRTRRPGLQVLRALILVAATISAFFALASLKLTELTSITFSYPLGVVLLAGPVIGEWADRRRVAAALAGFLGVLVVTRPGLGGLQPAMLLAAFASLCMTFYALAGRRLAAYDPPLTTLFYTGLVGSAVLLPVLPFVWETPSSITTWSVMGVLSVVGVVGHFMLNLAYRLAPPAVLAPFLYAQLIWAALLGQMVFGEVPGPWTLIGATMIAASGLYLIRLERPARERSGAATPANADRRFGALADDKEAC